MNSMRINPRGVRRRRSDPQVVVHTHTHAHLPSQLILDMQAVFFSSLMSRSTVVASAG
ncbi:hypothetical protein BC939DRAFT_457050 [Gamsiella multidivaricata]|uniref:uncharacterized protein n=1 Tax=Gamsiella multidivaricata TaxID=101098 RepID=UPI002220B3E2|nr:uncharacterized protein BC939DRAFT_457050 [Gamsiella multidivaricata]KAI7820825.1 hypothetical protein BC939DRAFT_457050 [Gamsiella multidivaricata]